MACGSAQQTPLSAWFLSSAASVRSGQGHFVETTNALKTPIGAKVGEYYLYSVVQNV